MESHQDKIAVISGGSNGIGQAFAERLAQDGAHIVIADIARADETVKMVEQAGGERSPASATYPRWTRSRRLPMTSCDVLGAAIS